MKLFLKILALIITIFQTNICEAKVILFADIISEPTFSNIFNSEKNSAELKGIFSESGIANTCKSENDLVDYRNRGVRVEANAAKGGSNIALGVTEHLDDFARSVNGSTWKTWGAQDF